MQGERGWRRFAGAILGVLASTALAGCGSSGRMPATGGVAPAEYMARFSGQWTFDDDVSEDPSQVIPPGTAQEAAGGGGGGGVAPPAGGGVGAPGGRRGRRGGRRAPRRAPDTAALRLTFDTFRSIPDVFSLSVSDSTVVTTWAGDREVRLEVAGDGVSRTVGEERVDLSARWEGGLLRIERRVPGGGTVVDLVEALPERPRLLVTRRIEGFPGMQAEVRLAFGRAQG